MRNEVLDRVKKEALTRGLSVSETIGILVEKSFESEIANRSEGICRGPGMEPETIKKMIEEATKNIHVSSPGIDQGAIKKIIAEAIDPIVASVVTMRSEVRGISAKSGQEISCGSSPEMNKQTIWETVFEAVASAMKRQESIRFIAGRTARINALLNELSTKYDMAGHSNRSTKADGWEKEETKRLFGG
ncbi:hypothetical protein ABH19_11945 [Leptospirillum sp. Group II 'CF-1']|jgi:hypothetical protein|nr:hypothetical protein ABH19_11945 [Leptospirillum sp. Group II 'CF-1']